MSEAAPRLFADADAYQRFMGRWSSRLAQKFLDFAGLKDGERVLDVGAGTGSLIAAIAERAPRAAISGIDPSPEYVAYAAARVPHAAVQVGDAQALPFEDASFDRTLCQLVMNFIPDARRAAAEMRRVTRPAGTVAAANWNFDGMRMLGEFWDAVGPSPLVNRHGERGSAFTREELIELWRESGLTGVEAADISIVTEFASFDDYWLPFLLGQGPAGVFAVALAPSEQAALRERLQARLLGGGPDRPFSLEARAFAVRGAVRK
ncbi:MAG: methyltransferase domain-containing protein [Candidatus Eremiobacteraeota bacterium]|nr:methyltransferase domain-containing protein [Candidatus Eremiobacteraeota bacterium]MBV8365031.1 methyltransferase domain-containing protein [Candidatus Eremiobacteraeota bacterium]